MKIESKKIWTQTNTLINLYFYTKDKAANREMHDFCENTFLWFIKFAFFFIILNDSDKKKIL